MDYRAAARQHDGVSTKSLVMEPWNVVAQVIREQILCGEFAPGERLVESELAVRFGTSRGPVHSALRELEKSGLVVVRPRKGTFVRDLAPSDIEEIFSIWQVLWAFAIHRAMARMNGTRLAHLRDLVPPLEEAPDSLETIRKSLAFYSQVFQYADHSLLVEIWEQLADRAQFRLVVAAGAKRRAALGVRLVAEIFAAIEGNDEELARSLSGVWHERLRDLLGLGRTGDVVDEQNGVAHEE